jgi:branched-chain amino acid transport system permease protein
MMGRLPLSLSLPLLLAVLVVPAAIRSNYTMQLVDLALINVVVVIGLNFVTGYTGQINFGQAAFYGIGAYTTALLTKAGLSFWLALPASALAAALFALVLGIPTLRLRTFYLAMATIGFGEIVRLVLVHWESVTGGSSGVRAIPGITLGPFPLVSHWQFYYLFLAFAALAILVAVRVRRSWLGRAMIATRDSEIAAELSGVDTVRAKIAALVLAAVYAGLAGAVYAGYVRYISPDQFSNQQAVLFFTMLIVGGTGSIIGAVTGALTLTFLPEALRFLHDWYMVFYGAGVIAIIVFMPEGIVGLARRLRRIAPLAPAIGGSVR